MTTPYDGGTTKNEINSYYENGSLSGNIVTFTNEYNNTHGGATPSILAPAYRAEFGASLHVRASSVAIETKINSDGLTFNSTYSKDPKKKLVDFEYESTDSERDEYSTGQEGAQGRAIFYTDGVETRKNMERTHEFGRDREINKAGRNNTISDIYKHTTTSSDIFFSRGFKSGSDVSESAGLDNILSPAINDTEIKVKNVDIP